MNAIATRWTWMQAAATALALSMGTGCSERNADEGGETSDEDGGEDGGDDGADTGGGEGDELYDPDRIIQIDIELVPEDWDTIRRQTRTLLDILGPGCLDEPFGSPFTYVSGTVTVDGTELDDVGVRKKGFLGSLDEERPSLKLKFDEYVPEQLLRTRERMTLNNNLQDPSWIHQCLGYAIFADAGVPSPRCNFAHVRVNGKDLGIYTNVEPVKKRFLRRHFDDDEGQLYEGTLSDFKDGWAATFEQKTNKDVPYDRGDLEAVVAALEAPDDQLLAELEQIVDVDEFLTFWATEVLVAHWDGYAGNTNNYFVYNDPTTGTLSFIPWGIDNILNDQDKQETGPHVSVKAVGHMARRLYMAPALRDRYVARMFEVLDAVWDEDALTAEVDRMEALLDPYLDDKARAVIEEVRWFISVQRGRIEAELAPSPPVWDEPPRDEICFRELGTLDATFSTTFGTLEGEDPFADGDGTITGDVEGTPLAPTMVGAQAGISTDEGKDSAVVQMIGRNPDGTLLVVFVQVAPEEFVGGASVEVDWNAAFALLVSYDENTGAEEVLGALGGGSVGLEMGGAGDGAPVTGTVAGPVVEFIF